ncbi:alpha,alpha-trehalose-phosphate synthase (UDP-forming) [Georgenia sp. Z1344]|uniref:alpha,alpha-trehalose-phosphate synthase (UDP-forming) n=1 Tax=Georgenia sp. Z1344 TaxID=3416706 RepID=UPI003CF12D86
MTRSTTSTSTTDDDATTGPVDAAGDGYDLVVVANRLAVDAVEGPDGETEWRRSPGGLVTALAPIMQSVEGAWIGWTGATAEDEETPAPFDAVGMHLVPVPLRATEVERYYEGMANGTLWPLYHDVIVQPEFHREWWDAYRRVNQRFADAAVETVAEGGTVWVHDYQLQLVPSLIRTRRPDVRIGFFNHIPFPPVEIFTQLPWRRQVVDGLLGADVVGFQRESDAGNFLRAVRRLTDHPTRGDQVRVRPSSLLPEERSVRARAFPISIDSEGFAEKAARPEVRERARAIRKELGDPRTVLLGVDRLDYTKGILHRIKAYGELVRDGLLKADETVLVQVASPSRERVEQYKVLRDEVEVAVARINGDHGDIGSAPISYLHQSFPPEEMAAMFLAADVALVTSLRDGMNLVAKEYIAAREDLGGALVLSEFTGAADELPQAFMVNPHDIDGLKAAIVQATHLNAQEGRRRMRSMRRRVMTHDVQRWADDFLGYLAQAHPRGLAEGSGHGNGSAHAEGSGHTSDDAGHAPDDDGHAPDDDGPATGAASTQEDR